MIHEIWDILTISLSAIAAVEIVFIIVFIYIKMKNIKKKLAAMEGGETSDT